MIACELTAFLHQFLAHDVLISSGTGMIRDGRQRLKSNLESRYASARRHLPQILKIWFVQDLVAVSGDAAKKDIEQILNLLVSDYALSSQPNSRKGGLIGLAAAALALGPGVHRSCYSVQPIQYLK